MSLLTYPLFFSFNYYLFRFLHQQTHLASVLLLLIEEAGVPLPISGDFVISYIGYRVQSGIVSLPVAYITLMIAVLVGSSFLFWLSKRWGQLIVLKLGKYIHLDEHSLLDLERKFKKYGVWVIIFGRHIPILRVPITVFAGMSKISYRTFIIYTFFTSLAWVGFYLYLGMRFGITLVNFIHAHRYLSLLTLPVLILGWLIYFKFFGANKPKKKIPLTLGL